MWHITIQTSPGVVFRPFFLYNFQLWNRVSPSKIRFWGWSKAIWMRWLLVRWSLVIHFYVRINFSGKEFNWKANCETIRKCWFCDPSNTYQSLVEKLFGPMSFDEKIMGRNKIMNVPIISESKLRLMSQFSIKVYVGNTPPKSSFNDDGILPEHFFWPRPNDTHWLHFGTTESSPYQHHDDQN